MMFYALTNYYQQKFAKGISGSLIFPRNFPLNIWIRQTSPSPKEISLLKFFNDKRFSLYVQVNAFGEISFTERAFFTFFC